MTERTGRCTAVDRLTLAPLTNFDFGALLAATIAIVAYRARALTASGAVAAALVGTAIFGSGGWRNAVVLLAFFVTSTALSQLGKRSSTKLALLRIGKSGARDGAQVLANGGVAAACALAAITGPAIWQVAFVGAVAAATADTWGTEIGALRDVPPRSILTGKRISAGLSGGVSLLGSVAEAAGALFLAAIAWSIHASPVLLAVAAGGFGGALIDSLLGASVQALRFCRGCAELCESDPHRCGADTTLVRGVSWITNDAVNFLATAGGAAIAAALYVTR
ncbi:MAG: DUF92 domain-containing protein [Candidatus Eremiobacteraeota bacterium]|nr:DUF92 domain-containing protein [Candidatus Eremiobacteraeota bacterium]